MKKVFTLLILLVAMVAPVVSQTHLFVDKDRALKFTFHNQGNPQVNLREVLTERKDGRRIVLTLHPESLEQLRSGYWNKTNLAELEGELMHALGVDGPLRACRDDEVSDLTRFIRPPIGGYCKHPRR